MRWNGGGSGEGMAGQARVVEEAPETEADQGGARDPRGRADVAFGLIGHTYIHYI